mgnify:FL=1
MADETKQKIKKAIGKAAAAVSPGAKLAKTLADLRNKKKKADFQKGDYSDIDSDETITLELKEKSMEAPKNPNSKLKFKSMQAPSRNDNSVEMPKFKIKKTTTVPKYPKEFKSGGRAGYSVGGKAIKGVSKILLKK